MRFTLHCVNLNDDANTKAKFFYDNATGLLHNDMGAPVGDVCPDLADYAPAFKAHPEKNPIRKHNRPKTVKIQLGLSCNYSCDYCLQRFVPGADETSAKHVDSFLEKLHKNLKVPPEKIELWGGEPLVYIKTLKPLVSGLREKYPHVKFSMITNGSLLTKELNDWIMEYDIAVSISHDGPGQSVRGPDPFDDPDVSEAIFDLYNRKKEAGDNLGFGAMIHAKNADRAEIAQWFEEKFGEPVFLGEGALVEIYDEGAMDSAVTDREDHLNLRTTSFRNIRSGADSSFMITRQRMDDYYTTMRSGRMLDSLSMKCSMDKPDILTVDLRGEVITCQNVNINAVAENGAPHRAGSLDNLHGVEIRTAIHFLNRDHCHGCPVVQTCKGGCMYLSEDLFKASCNNTYTDHIPYFVAAVEAITGFAPVYIEDEAGYLPEDRKDIFGMGKPE
jgi:uncharacterized protein